MKKHFIRRIGMVLLMLVASTVMASADGLFRIVEGIPD